MQRNFAYVHKNGCGKAAFYMEAEPVPGGPVPGSRDVLLPDGTHPLPFSAMRCGSCGKMLTGGAGGLFVSALKTAYVEAVR